MDYAHEKAANALKELTSTSTDHDIAHKLAMYLLVGKHAPFVFTINHNAKAAPCPVKIDKPMGAKRCMVAIRSPQEALNWCTDALMRGYEVSCGTQRGQETQSITAQRRDIEWRAKMIAYKAERTRLKEAGLPDPEDTIPF